MGDMGTVWHMGTAWKGALEDVGTVWGGCRGMKMSPVAVKTPGMPMGTRAGTR